MLWLYLLIKEDISKSFTRSLPKRVWAILALVEVLEGHFCAQIISGLNLVWIVDWKIYKKLSF